MHKHSLFMPSIDKGNIALDWILANQDGIEDWDFSSSGTVLNFYTAFPLTEQQKHVIVSTVEPISFLSEEL